ncbi:hypothetical protein BLNAU_6808 [Blattamonas nauphoetae]|uniref:Uncharacterized protein n=1 Tax=Blattamonas nauphoetae TaxID=2049346 RepID=A0ABQ9Y3N3_9EUKA|nr:hypothetical protein BLNAU_6808 [Blattamonas nauphoetae]
MQSRILSSDLVQRIVDNTDVPGFSRDNSFAHSEAAGFLKAMLDPKAENLATRMEVYPSLRVFVFEPMKPYIHFLISNSHRLCLRGRDRINFECSLIGMFWQILDIEQHTIGIEDEFVRFLVKWEVDWLTDLEDDDLLDLFVIPFSVRSLHTGKLPSSLMKRRKGWLRSEGWEDALELRVMEQSRGADGFIRPRIFLLRLEYKLDMRFI